MRLQGFSLTATLVLCALAGCGHHAKTSYTPPPPALPPGQPAYPSTATRSYPAPPPPAESPSDQAAIDNRRPIYSETGMASWYGPKYNKQRAANGDVYDQEGISAAHRTLPMGSLIRVTNLQTGQSAMMHVTDRGPFVPDRVIDLSVGAAKMIGVWRPGTARVRIDVYEAPKSIAQGGRWCVQIGAFSSGHDAKKLEDHLSHKYQTANVIEFTGPTGHWVRIRPQADDKSKAVEIAKEINPKEGEAYLVRLD
ncbi:septal ring lytic transglycosylase RlpA family protein [Silvibacterium acidisoli]|uniref:septal ring lytic transglycosylase RlpA family protein n=1 Tax=Acidobacteriaceae bacterium ZG23-2 TaxID=2883246 RepID=UPI00406D3AE6